LFKYIWSKIKQVSYVHNVFRDLISMLRIFIFNTQFILLTIFYLSINKWFWVTHNEPFLVPK